MVSSTLELSTESDLRSHQVRINEAFSWPSTVPLLSLRIFHLLSPWEDCPYPLKWSAPGEQRVEFLFLCLSSRPNTMYVWGSLHLFAEFRREALRKCRPWERVPLAVFLGMRARVHLCQHLLRPLHKMRIPSHRLVTRCQGWIGNLHCFQGLLR